MGLLARIGVACAIFACAAVAQTGESGAGQPDAASMQAGQPAPELQLTGMLQAPEGTPLTLGHLRGKVVVLDFWFIRCGPCVAVGIPHINRLAEEFKDRPVEFISITFDPQEEVEEFVSRIPMKGWIGIDEGQATSKAYAVFSYPTTVVIDAEGRLAARGYPTAITSSVLEAVLEGKPTNLPTDNEAKLAAQNQLAQKVRPAMNVSVRVLTEEPITDAMSPLSFGSLPDGRRYSTIWAIGTTLKFTLAQMWFLPEERVLGAKVAGDIWLKVESTIPWRPGEPWEQAAARARDVVTEAIEDALDIEITVEARPTMACILTPVEGMNVELEVVEGLRPPSRMYDPEKGELIASACGLGDAGIILEDLLGLPVVYEGPEGTYNYHLKWDPKDPRGKSRALLETLGLEMSMAERNLPWCIITKRTAPEEGKADGAGQ